MALCSGHTVGKRANERILFGDGGFGPDGRRDLVTYYMQLPGGQLRDACLTRRSSSGQNRLPEHLEPLNPGPIRSTVPGRRKRDDSLISTGMSWNTILGHLVGPLVPRCDSIQHAPGGPRRTRTSHQYGGTWQFEGNNKAIVKGS